MDRAPRRSAQRRWTALASSTPRTQDRKASEQADAAQDASALVANPLILGIESTCDETAAALVRRAPDGKPEILANAVFDQNDLHARFGGVVPEIAARAHVERLDHAVEAALAEAGLALSAVDAIAVSAGPGLIGGVLAGVVFARALAAPRGLPCIGVNHLEGHALSPRLDPGLAYPYLLLLVSGGHCQLLMVEGLGRYRRLGATIDDAPGEAFDKIARHLDLGFPGGPAISRWAEKGDPARFALPRPLLDRPGCDLSFSGLKTAARLECDRLVAAQGGLHDQDLADLCAGFEAAIAETLTEKTRRAIALFRAEHPQGGGLAIAGGVAANRRLRASLEALAAQEGLPLAAPPLALCTDNGAMIAYAGLERLEAGAAGDAPILARPRWPLDETAPAMLGGGKRGAKA